MSNEGHKIEDFFQKGFNNFSETPTKKVLKSIKRKLFWDDYFSLRYNKINVGYTTLIVAGLALLLSSNSKKDNSKNLAKKNNATKNEIISLDSSSNLDVHEENIAAEKNKKSEEIIALAAVAKFSPSIESGCAPLSIKFNNTSAHADSYIWDFGNGETSTKKNPDYTFKKPGEYIITLTAKNSIGTDLHISKVIVHENPVSNAAINIEKSSVEDTTVVFINNSKKASQYKWIFDDGTIASSKETKHKYNKPGIYKVTSIAINEYGCSDTATLTNKFIEKDYLLSFPSTFRPNPINRDNNGYYTSAENEQFVFYPHNNGATKYSLEVLTLNGHMVFKSSDIKYGWNGYIKGRLAPAGEYMYRAKGIYPNGKSFKYTGTFHVIVDNYNDYY